MNRSWDEQKVLNKLGIEDFRHADKNTLIEFVSKIDKIDPEVAKKLIQQIPEFASLAKESVNSLTETFNKLIDSDDNMSHKVVESYNLILKALDDILSKDDLLFEEKREVIDRMETICDKIRQADIDHKKANLAKGALVVGGVIGGLIPVIGALGGNLKINGPKKS